MEKQQQSDAVAAYKLRWSDFLQWALERQEAEGMPDDNGQGCVGRDGRGLTFRTPLWTLARLIKGYRPEWTAEHAWRRVNSMVRRGLGGWKSQGFRFSRGELEAQFIDAWDKVRRPGLESALEEAARLAADAAFPVPTEQHPRSPEYKTFLRFCGHLAELIGRQAVGLSQRNVGKALGVRPNTIGVWIRWGIEEGFLELKKPARASKNPMASRAARYRVADYLLKAAEEVNLPLVVIPDEDMEID